MARQVRVGLVGCGGIAKAHARGLIEATNCKLVALAEPDAERLRQMLEITGELPAWDSYEAMVEEANIDAVLIALPTSMHADSSVHCLQAGKHVLCEKPPAVSAREMAAVVDAARASGKTYMFARQQRFSPTKLEAHRRATSGKLGRVYHSETTWLRTRMIPFRGGWGVNKQAGGGVLLDLGVHAIDDAWFVMGCPKPVEAFAGMHCAVSRLAPEDLTMPYDADDSAMGMIRFEDGQTLSFTVTFALNSAGPHGEVERLAGNGLVELRVFGEEGGIDVGNSLFISGKTSKVKTSELKMTRKYKYPHNSMAAQAYEFCRAIAKGDEPMNTGEQALQLMKMLDAVRRSAEEGKSVSV
jgi:predicted dehydrogenase